MLNEIVVVNVSRETTSVSQAGFGTVLILGAHKVFNERLRFYSSASAMLTDGFAVTDPEYLAAVAALSQSPRPTRVAIGRRTVNNSAVVVNTAVINTVYTIRINGTSYTFNSGGAPTTSTIATGLAAAINADGALPVTATATTNTVSLVADVAGTAYSLAIVGSNMTITKPYTASDTFANDLTAVSAYNDDWYGLVVTSRVQADVEAVAAWVETQRKLFLTVSSDVGILAAGTTTDVGSVLKTSAYTRTGVIYHTDPTKYADAAWFGTMLTTAPGSATWAFKDLISVPTVTLTLSESSAAQGKNVNLYQSIAGANITRYGKVASGEYIDVIVGIDWFQARLQERIYSLLVNSARIPYTDAGIATVEGAVKAQLQQGISVGLFAADPAPTVTVPKAINVSAANKAARTLTDVTFAATLAGAVHLTTINGTVSV